MRKTGVVLILVAAVLSVLTVVVPAACWAYGELVHQRPLDRAEERTATAMTSALAATGPQVTLVEAAPVGRRDLSLRIEYVRFEPGDAGLAAELDQVAAAFWRVATVDGGRVSIRPMEVPSSPGREPGVPAGDGLELSRADLTAKLGPRPDVPGRLGADHGAALGGHRAVFTERIVPAALVMAVVAFLLWVTGTTLWAVGRRRRPRPVPSISPAQGVLHSADGRIGPGAWKE